MMLIADNDRDIILIYATFQLKLTHAYENANFDIFPLVEPQT